MCRHPGTIFFLWSGPLIGITPEPIKQYEP